MHLAFKTNSIPRRVIGILAGVFGLVTIFQADWGIWEERHWACSFSVFIAGATALAAVGFGFVIAAGHAFEMHSVGALAFRFMVWAGIAAWLMNDVTG